MWKFIGGGVVVLFIIGAIAGAGDDDKSKDENNDGSSGGGKSSQTSTTRDNGDKLGAQVICETFVKRQLKAPSTADFSGAAVRHLSGPRWIVVGDVDAENSFGAKLRSKYSCTVRYQGNDNWRLLDLSGLG